MPKLTNQHIAELNTLLPNKIATSQDAASNSNEVMFYLNNYPSDATFFVESEADVVAAVNYCIKNKIPIIPYGSGTSVEGHTAAIQGGICLNVSKMRGILEFSPDDGLVTVQPGISYNELNEYLAPHGFHFPVEAGWGASIGGMVATNASGAGAVHAGSMAKNVTSCTLIVYKDNQACKIQTGSKSLKSSAGYNLNNLIIGSEGTLGVITAVTLRIRSNHQQQKTIVSQFSDIYQAINAVIALKKCVHFHRVELMDQLQTEACIAYSKINFLDKKRHTLLIELAGNTKAVEEEAEIVSNYLNRHHAFNTNVFNEAEQSKLIWMMRKNALPAAIQFIDKNKKALNTDICVPLSRLADCIHACYKHLHAAEIKAPLVAHVGDGNFHFSIVVDPNNANEMRVVNEFNRSVINEALKYEGSCTGEHGIGLGKIDYLEKEHGDLIFLMRHIKNAFDPYHIFNPGKIFRLHETNLNTQVLT